MKKALLILTGVISMITDTGAQNIGIGNASPIYPLHVTAAGNYGLLVENANNLDLGVTSSMLFGANVNGGTYKYSGAIKTIGTSISSARLAFFTYATSSAGNLKERMSILDDGRIGIGTADPRFQLHIASYNGNLLLENPNILSAGVTSSMFFGSNINDINSYQYTGAIKTIGTSNSEARMGFYTNTGATTGSLQERMTILDNGFVGIATTAPTALLDVNGTIRGNNLIVDNDLDIAGDLTVNNGKGIVRSYNGTQQKIYSRDASFSVSLGAFGHIDGTMGYASAGFTTAPRIFVGDIVGTPSGDWHKMKVVITEAGPTGCNVRIYNDSNTSISASATFSILCLGN